MNLKGKVAVITGSTSGIGLGIAQALASTGADILLNGFGDLTEIETLRQHLEQTYQVRVAYHSANVTNPADVQSMIDYAAEMFGRVDILVNNAGIQHVDPIESFPLEKWDQILATNLSSVFYGTRAVLWGMKQQGWGRIINIASVHGLVASINKSAYVAAKHGVVGLTKVTALESVGTGVTANAICPGWVLTPLVQKQIDALAQRKNISLEQAQIELLSEKQPSKQFVQPEQIGQMVLFLCSDAATQMTGSTWTMDGGWTVQ